MQDTILSPVIQILPNFVIIMVYVCIVLLTFVYEKLNKYCLVILVSYTIINHHTTGLLGNMKNISMYTSSELNTVINTQYMNNTVLFFTTITFNLGTV